MLGLGQLLESQMYSRPMALDLLWPASSSQSLLYAHHQVTSICPASYDVAFSAQSAHLRDGCGCQAIPKSFGAPYSALQQAQQGHTRAVCSQVLQRGQEVSKRDWKVLRVAIVELRDQTYIGRLFFGDADSGAVVWDCDCRPSDGCWIALKVRLFCMHGHPESCLF